MLVIRINEVSLIVNRWHGLVDKLSNLNANSKVCTSRVSMRLSVAYREDDVPSERQSFFSSLPDQAVEEVK